jgi:hypothetical protein
MNGYITADCCCYDLEDVRRSDTGVIGGSGETSVTVRISKRSMVSDRDGMSSNGNSDGSGDCDLGDAVVVDGLSVVRLRDGDWVRDALVHGLVGLDSPFRVDVSVLGRQVGHLLQSHLHKVHN